jgi:hypothetical protein
MPLESLLINGVVGVRVGANAITNLGYEWKIDGCIMFNIEGAEGLHLDSRAGIYRLDVLCQ